MNKLKNMFLTKGLTIVASIALMVTMSNVNSNCIWLSHQPKLPEGADKLRKIR